MNRNQSARIKQYLSGGRALLLVAGFVSLSQVAAHRGMADESALDQAIFNGQTQVLTGHHILGDERLAGIRGKYVDRRVELTDAVILWDERPAGGGQGAGGDQSGNRAQGVGNYQVTNVTTQRSQ